MLYEVITGASSSGSASLSSGEPASAPASANASASAPTSAVQVWHSTDARIIPMQKAQEQRDLARTRNNFV